jgi:hypothetical protein
LRGYRAVHTRTAQVVILVVMVPPVSRTGTPYGPAPGQPHRVVGATVDGAPRALSGAMNAEILIDGRWTRCRLLVQGMTLQAWFRVGVVEDGEETDAPAMMQVPIGGQVRLRVCGEVDC